MKVVLLLVYITGGDLVVNKSYHNTMELCQSAANIKTAAISREPKFEGGLLAICVPNQKVQEV